MSRILMRYRLWKSVENVSRSRKPLAGMEMLPLAVLRDPSGAASLQPMEACSACAGDYEDPDRTAGGEEENDASEVDDEFPAEEE
jgi:hypothetical protein